MNTGLNETWIPRLAKYKDYYVFFLLLVIKSLVEIFFPR